MAISTAAVSIFRDDGRVADAAQRSLPVRMMAGGTHTPVIIKERRRNINEAKQTFLS